MNVAEAPRRRTRVRLPGDVQRPFEVYLNGVQQQEGADFVVREGALVFDRPLVREKVGKGRADPRFYSMDFNMVINRYNMMISMSNAFR